MMGEDLTICLQGIKQNKNKNNTKFSKKYTVYYYYYTTTTTTTIILAIYLFVNNTVSHLLLVLVCSIIKLEQNILFYTS